MTIGMVTRPHESGRGQARMIAVGLAPISLVPTVLRGNAILDAPRRLPHRRPSQEDAGASQMAFPRRTVGTRDMGKAPNEAKARPRRERSHWHNGQGDERSQGTSPARNVPIGMMGKAPNEANDPSPARNEPIGKLGKAPNEQSLTMRMGTPTERSQWPSPAAKDAIGKLGKAPRSEDPLAELGKAPERSQGTSPARNEAIGKMGKAPNEAIGKLGKAPNEAKSGRAERSQIRPRRTKPVRAAGRVIGVGVSRKICQTPNPRGRRSFSPTSHAPGPKGM